MKARVVAQMAAPMLRAIQARDAAIMRDIDKHLANLDWWAREVCHDLIAQAVRAVLDELPLTPEQRKEAPEIVRRALRRFAASESDDATTVEGATSE